MDAIRAAFPVGTLSGSPKIRAMEIINELEPVKQTRDRMKKLSLLSNDPTSGPFGYLSNKSWVFVSSATLLPLF